MMLVDGHEIESSHPRVRLWDEIVALETIAQWSALTECVSSDSLTLEPTSSYMCTLQKSSNRSQVSVEVTGYDLGYLLALRTLTPFANLDERFVFKDHLGGSILTYSIDADSAHFGPGVNVWLVDHINLVCERLEHFANTV